MRAIFIAVGSEMLNQDRLDTNSLYVARRLRERGILLDMKMTVGDHIDNLTWVVRKASRHAQLLIVCGGLGPTEDDITREAVAAALQRELVFDEGLVENLRELFRQRGMAMPEINARQAFLIAGAEIIPNAAGTAPGQFLDVGYCKVLLLPGPPSEMIPMFDRLLEERIGPLSRFFITTRVFKFAGITESETDSLIADLYTRYENPVTTILASPTGIELHLLGRSKNSVDEARRLTDELAAKIRERLRSYIYAEKDISLPEAIVAELKKRKMTLAVAESCSGGGLGNLITSVPGSSQVFMGGVIAYANELKIKILKVKETTLRRHGAVSEATADEMAAGVRRLTGADIGLAVTGIAGPQGGSPSKPVGLVYMHLRAGSQCRSIRRIFSGSREVIKLRSAHYALNLLREYLLGDER